MKLTILLYLVDLLDNLRNSIIIGTLISITVFLTSLATILVNHDDLPDERKEREKWDRFERRAKKICSMARSSVKASIMVFITLIFVYIFVPVKQTIYLMISAHYLTEGTIPIKIKDILESKLDEVLIQTKQDVKDKIKQISEDKS